MNYANTDARPNTVLLRGLVELTKQGRKKAVVRSLASLDAEERDAMTNALAAEVRRLGLAPAVAPAAPAKPRVIRHRGSYMR